VQQCVAVCVADTHVDHMMTHMSVTHGDIALQCSVLQFVLQTHTAEEAP